MTLATRMELFFEGIDQDGAGLGLPHFITGVRNKAKFPAPKVGTECHQIFNKNRGYKGSDRITTVMWISALCSVKGWTDLPSDGIGRRVTTDLLEGTSKDEYLLPDSHLQPPSRL